MQKIISKQNISIFIILFICLIFSYKYIGRYIDFPLLISIPLILVYYFLLNGNFMKFPNKISRIISYLAIISFIIFSFIIFKLTSVEELNVDRWSVIKEFWDAFFENSYPYYAKSNDGNPPGPMPFYFILALPFYLVGEIGVISLLGIVLVTILILRSNNSSNIKLSYIIFVFVAVFSLWEVLTRSNIIFNSILVLFVLIHFEKVKKESRSFLIINAILSGLLLSTRSIFALPYLIVFLSALNRKEICLKNMLLYGIVSLLSFLLTFSPFLLYYYNDFWQMNPFIVQSSFLLPVGYIVFFIVISFSISFIVKSKVDSYFYSGLMLFSIIAFYFGYHIITNGFYETYIDSKGDVSYFLFCVPFLYYYIIKKKEVIDNNKLSI